MLKTVLKIDGMMCGMCESHMNDLIRKHCKVKKVSSSAKKGQTYKISTPKEAICGKSDAAARSVPSGVNVRSAI